MEEQAATVGTAGDGGEREVLEDAARSLRGFSDRLPAGSAWKVPFEEIADRAASAAGLIARCEDRAA